jgi:hypothetical protein
MFLVLEYALAELTALFGILLETHKVFTGN